MGSPGDGFTYEPVHASMRTSRGRRWARSTSSWVIARSRSHAIAALRVQRRSAARSSTAALSSWLTQQEMMGDSLTREILSHLPVVCPIDVPQEDVALVGQTKYGHAGHEEAEHDDEGGDHEIVNAHPMMARSRTLIATQPPFDCEPASSDEVLPSTVTTCDLRGL